MTNNRLDMTNETISQAKLKGSRIGNDSKTKSRTVEPFQEDFSNHKANTFKQNLKYKEIEVNNEKKLAPSKRKLK